LVYKVSNYFKKIVEKRKPERLFMLASGDVISVRIQTSSLFSLSLILMLIDEIGSLGLLTAGLQPLQASLA